MPHLPMKDTRPYLMLRVTPELHAALKALAAADRRSMSNYVRLLIENAVAKGGAK